MLCPNGRLVYFALDPPGRLLITRPDRPDWQWPVDYTTAQAERRYAITAPGALAARSLVSDPPSVLPSSEQTESPLHGAAIQLGHNLENRKPERPDKDTFDQSKVIRKRAGGRHPLASAEVAKREALLKRWDQAKKARVSRKGFCADAEVSHEYLETCINWRATRRRRNSRS